MLLKKIPDDVIIVIHATSLSYKKKRNIKDTSLRYSTNNIVGIVSFLTRSQGNDNRKKSFDRDKRSIVSKLSETSPTININCRKESAIFSLLEERIWPDSLYIYIYYHDNLDVAMSINDHSLVFGGTHYRSDTVYSSPRWTSCGSSFVAEFHAMETIVGRGEVEEPRGSFHPIAV